MSEPPLALSVAAGVLIAAFFMVVFNQGVRLVRNGRSGWGWTLTLGAVLYGFAFVYSAF